MRKEDEISKGIKNPYIKQNKVTITIRLDQATIAYFKQLSEKVSLPYQTLINTYLTDCARRQLKLNITWQDNNSDQLQNIQ